jgi:hypothetical protein
MDPNAALEAARTAATDYENATSPAQEEDAAERLVSNFVALDWWLSKEGFLPGAWAIPGERG